MRGHRYKRGAGLALTLPKTMPRMLLLLVAFLLALVSTGAVSQPAFATGGGHGNNGTLKVHEEGTPSGTESNDPKICEPFNFEGFGFDAGQTGVIKIAGQGQTPGGVVTTLGFGPANDAGYYATAYVGKGAIPDGHYKATLYDDAGKVKAKSKVFKIACKDDTPPPPEVTEVTATAPTSVDKCGTKDDTYTVPSTEGVEYLVDGKVTKAGTYPGTGTVPIEARAIDGYKLKGTSSWTFKFSDESCEQPPPPVVEGKGHVEVDKSCVGQVGLDLTAFNDVEGSEPIDFVVTDNQTGKPVPGVDLTNVEYGSFRTGNIPLRDGDKYDLTVTGPGGYSERFHGTFYCGDTPPPEVTEVTATAPTSVDKCGTKDDTYTVPSTEGVEYLVDGKVTKAGTYPGTGTVPIEARAIDGYKLKGTSSWTFKFSDESCEQPPVYNPMGSLSSECEVADGSKTGFTAVDAVLDNRKSNVEVTFEVVETIDGKTNYYQIPVGAGEIVTPQVFYSSDDGKMVELTLNALDTQVAHLKFETATCGVPVTPPPPTKTCPAGTKWVDLNGNGMVDKGECKKPQPPVDHNPPVNNPPAPQPPVQHNPPVNNTLNPGFGAHTGWGEDVSDTQGGNASGMVYGLLAAGLFGLAFVRRRKSGDARA